MNYIELPGNYKRSLTSALYIVESHIDEIYFLLTSEVNKNLLQIEKNIENEDIDKIISVLKELKVKVIEIKQKYNLIPIKFTLKQLISSKISKIWEILIDSTSERMSGYGKLQQDLIKEYNSDILDLLNLVELLNYGKKTG